MPAKRYKLALQTSSQKISKAKKALKAMPKEKRIDLTVQAGVMTDKQAARAKKKLAEGSD